MRKIPLLAFALIITLLSIVLLGSNQPAIITPVGQVLAQDNTCQATLDELVLNAIQTCDGILSNQLCVASGEAEFSPATTASKGTTLDLATLSRASIKGSETEMAFMRFNLADAQLTKANLFATAYILGDLSVEPASSDMVSWLNLSVQADEMANDCEDTLPANGLMVQSPTGQLFTVTINGVKLTMNDTLFVTLDGETTHFNILRGNVIAEYNKSIQVAFAGYSLQITPDDTALGAPAIYSEATVANLPTQLLPHIVNIPLPGNVILQQSSELKVEASVNAVKLTDLLPGTVLNLLGQDPSGDWWNVIREDGMSGWVQTTAITGVFPPNAPIFSATPQPPTRPYGMVMGRATTPANEVNLRATPNTEGTILGKLTPLTEFSILGRNNNADWIQIRLDEPTADGVNEGWLAAWILDLPSTIRVQDLPVAQE